MFSNLFKPFNAILSLLLAMTMIILPGCTAIPMIGGAAAMVPVKALVLRIVVAAGVATLEVLLEENGGLRVDIQKLIDQIITDEGDTGVPPTDVPILMIVSKNTNDIYYWQLTNKVKMVSLHHDQPGSVELKVINESPLRIEMWIDGDIEEAIITVEMKE